MRIISGTYRGLTVTGFDIKGTRPTMDRVKESMFAMIQGHIKNQVVLDLFAGSGNLGLEAISNGAKKTYFVDFNQKAVSTILENIERMRITEAYEVLKMDYKLALKTLASRNIKFDVVLLDPPYRKSFINEILEQLVTMHLLAPQALVVCEYDQEELKSEHLTCIKERRYGNKYVKIYQNQIDGCN